jgi:hypothetical protein
MENQGEKLEVVAIRYALEFWLREGSPVGSFGSPLADVPTGSPSMGDQRLGVSVMGVSTLDELDETLRVWRSILDGLESLVNEPLPIAAPIGKSDVESFVNVPPTQEMANESSVGSEDAASSNAPGTLTPSNGISDPQWSRLRRQQILSLVQGARAVISKEWVDCTWDSPEKGFVNIRLPDDSAKNVDAPVAALEEVGDASVGRDEAGFLTPPLDGMDS